MLLRLELLFFFCSGISGGWAKSCGPIESPFLSGVEERLAGAILLSVHVDGKDCNAYHF